MSKIIVTGGAGFLGSHAVVELIAAGHAVAIIDNYRNSKPEAIDRIAEISGTSPQVFEADITDLVAIKSAFAEFKPNAVIHFAALKAVGESVSEPLDYHYNNDVGLLNVLKAAIESGVDSFVFSSSATVYGDPQTSPIDEGHPISSLNPYGSTKIVAEQILADVAAVYPDMRTVALRYFNPVGAHPSGLIGDDPEGIPNNLAPYIMRVAAGQLDQLSVFGDDYDTPDGTGVRDYIHVTDLIDGHIAALEKAPKGFSYYNLGTGRGHSVLEMIAAFKKASGKDVPYSVAPRRDGDSASCVADPSKANRELGWRADRTLDDMAESAWAFMVASL